MNPHPLPFPDPYPNCVPPRYFACAHYDDCLRQVCATKWPSWTCNECELAPPDLRVEYIADFDSILRKLLDDLSWG